jgi:hypothetical protein
MNRTNVLLLFAQMASCRIEHEIHYRPFALLLLLSFMKEKSDDAGRKAKEKEMQLLSGMEPTGGVSGGS